MFSFGFVKNRRTGGGGGEGRVRRRKLGRRKIKRKEGGDGFPCWVSNTKVK